MSLSAMPEGTAVAQAQFSLGADARLAVQTLTNEHESEVLEFLAERPLHTVFMTGFIRDNGLVSPLNRGIFYACREGKGRLEGVALIGHATLVEARTEGALAAFARLSQDCPSAHMILGEEDKVERFWNHYAETGCTPRLVCRELLFERRWPVSQGEQVPGLRPANIYDIADVLSVNAEMAFQESGVNPMEADPMGFLDRTTRRIEGGRVWVWVEDGHLIFKADVMADTPDVIYLEGVYVDPNERNKGYGLRCFSQLCSSLLSRARSICLLVNEQNLEARTFYERAGCKLRGYYATIFLSRKIN